MKEDFLHFLWQYQRLHHAKLKTTDNKPISVLKKGFANGNSGPDFQDAHLLIDEIEWVGNVEVHVKSSDWLRHGHQHDVAYNNVILHVVWQHDRELGNTVPTLQLAEYADQNLLSQYKKLMASEQTIACQGLFSLASEIKKLAMLDRVLLQRLQRKAELVLKRLAQNQGDWEETVFQLLAANFGFKLNTEAFTLLAERLSFRLLRKYSNSLFQVECLLFGAAGFLEQPQDSYAEKLKSEYDFLATKHQLQALQLETSLWRFLRTRPANFPTLRLSQLAALIVQQHSFLDAFTEHSDFQALEDLLAVEPAAYWKTHYHFGRSGPQQLTGMGRASRQNIIVNTIVPVLAAYSIFSDNQQFLDRAIDFLEKIPAERNRITDFWKHMGLPIKTMADSQGCIELYNECCQHKRCLQCSIGLEVLK